MIYSVYDLTTENLFELTGYGSIECDSEQLGDVGELVTISTGEGHYICVNLRYYTINLQQGNSSSSSSMYMF